MKNLIIRALTGIVLLISLIIFTILGRTSLLIMTTFLSLIGVYEFLNVTKKLDYIPNYGVTFVTSIIILLLSYFNLIRIEGTILIIYSFIIIIFMTFFEKFDLKTSFMQIFVIVYIPMSFSRIILLSDTYFIWLIYIISWGTDTFAYLAGSTLGKHKLSKNLSPKKSIEGAIGGIIGSGILSFVFAFYFKMDNIFLVVVMSLIGSIVAQVGDLCASKFKRLSGAKDYGNIFLGHGGVLDRFDSVLFTAPYIYLIYSLLH